MAFSYSYPSQASQTSPVSWSTDSWANQSAMFDALGPAIFDDSQDQYYSNETASTDIPWDVIPHPLQYDVQSPTGYGFDSRGSFDKSYDSSQTDSSQTNSSDSPPAATLDDLRGESRKRRRKTQNRESQRAYRARAREREEQTNGLIAQLQREIETLRSREKCNSEQVELLKAEIERLRNGK